MSDATAAEPGSNAAPEKAAKPAARKTAPAKKKAGPRNTGIKTSIKKLLLKNPKMSADEIAAKLAEARIECSSWTVLGIRSEFRHTLRVMADAGLIKIEM